MMSANKKRAFGLPEIYESVLEGELKRVGFSLTQPKALARCVRQLSDFYIANPRGQTPWREPWAQAASLAYYFPLNYARNRAVAFEGVRLGFFDGLDAVVDLGCGMGSGLLAFLDTKPFARATAVDISVEALRLCESLHQNRTPLTIRKDSIVSFSPEAPKETLLLSSFVMTELDRPPSEWKNARALAIVEPSTSTDARALQSYRQSLIESGFKIWGPCTHEDACPLLTDSAKDWCHDRIHWEAPPWFLEVERDLPMKNRTLTYSYLLARRDLAPPAGIKRCARLVGDPRVEKGKNRQAVCRGPEREFLAWFPGRMRQAEGSSLELQRGSLVELFEPLEKKANEIRLATSKKIRELPPGELP